MDRIILITMPVVAVQLPSLSLAQLKARIQERFDGRVNVEVQYFNHDFAAYMAEVERVDQATGMNSRGFFLKGSEGETKKIDLHKVLLDNQHLGLPDWMFRQIAFPELEDNADQYFRRMFPGRSEANKALKEALLERRNGLDKLLDELIDKYRLADARIVGFGSMFSQNVASFAMARKIKERNPNITTVIGGANCETPMGEQIALNVPHMDYVFSGPALISFPEFVEHYLAGEHDRCAAIRGVFTAKTVDREQRDRAGEELPIDVEVPLDYEDFFESFDRHFPEPTDAPVIFFETSRGCWCGERSHCTFCGLNSSSMNYRAMAPDKAIALFKSLLAQYRSRTPHFHTVDNIMPRNYVKEVLPFIDAPPETSIFYEVKADLKEDSLRTMAAAGIDKIQPGVESMASSTLALMRKGTTAFVNLRLFKSCIKYDISPAWNLLIGFPGETEEVYEKYVNDLHRLVHFRPPEGVFRVRFDRYSPYFVNEKEFGLQLRPLDFYSLVYPFDKDTLHQLAYYFMDGVFDAPYVAALAKWVGKIGQVVQGWTEKWSGEEGSHPRLELQRNGETATVIDTRGGDEVQHQLEGPTLRLLDFLERARKQSELDAWAQTEGIDLESEMRFLDERELIWQEGPRTMNIVVTHDDGESRDSKATAAHEAGALG